MEMTHETTTEDFDGFLYRKLVQARSLPEGVLPVEEVRLFYNFTNSHELLAWLKNYQKLDYDISADEEVVPLFTKHEIIKDIKEEYLRLRETYVFLNPPEPEWCL